VDRLEIIFDTPREKHETVQIDVSFVA
jgi:hypothetical protein